MIKARQLPHAFAFIVFSFFMVASACANKTSVKISTVKTAAKGTEVTVNIQVSHNANSPNHYTDWVYLKINGKEMKRWAFDRNHLPVSANFNLVYKFNINETSTIEVMGDCNLHGSAGSVTARITIK